MLQIFFRILSKKFNFYEIWEPLMTKKLDWNFLNNTTKDFQIFFIFI